MTTGRPIQYLPAVDERVRAVFSQSHGPIRADAIRSLASSLGVSASALRSRWHKLRIRDGGSVEHPHIASRREPKARPPSAVTLPVARPAWMTPITREQLMAGR